MIHISRPVMQTVRLSEEERATLEAMAEHEERNIGDVIRRALRAYAVQLGVAPKREQAAPRKTRSKTALPPKRADGPGPNPEPLCPSITNPFHHRERTEEPLKPSENPVGGQPTGPKAPAHSASAKPPQRPSNPPKGGARRGEFQGFLAQLDQLAAAVEANANDRDACAVAVAVRGLVKLARQPAPEGTRLTPTRTSDAAGLCWHPATPFYRT